MQSKDSPAELKLRILYPLVHWVRDTHGQVALEAGARGAGLTPNALVAGNAWASTVQVEAFCQHVWELCGADEAAFREVCAYRLREAYGPLRYLLWALTPQLVFRQAMRTMHVVSAGGRWEILDEGPGLLRSRYTCTPRESRALCLLRQVNASTMPTFWGLAAARVEESGCIGHGDDACEYTYRWQPARRRWPALLGALLGGLAGLAVLFAVPVAPSWAVAVLLLLLGGLLGDRLEARHDRRASAAFVAESHAALEKVAGEEAEARRQLALLGQRQDEWTALMERQLADRSAALGKVSTTLQQLQERRVTALRGFSHDLRNPLTIIRIAAETLQQALPDRADECAMLDEQIQAADRMDGILRELMAAALADDALPVVGAEDVETATLAGRLRAQLRALVFGKDIRVSVFATREAPAMISADRLLFARVVDNLLGNAAKYTDRGSIVVELDGRPGADGRPGSLVLKVSDTGRGIAEDAIEKVFQPQGSAAEQRAADSHGLGLSVVVRLLAQLGGGLEVMSQVGIGTTFWVSVPTVPPGQEEESTPLADVVKIRRVVN